MSILIVDDTAFMRKVLQNILDDIGIDTVYTAENGEEAVDVYLDKKPDLVLLDIVMEEMDGIEALKAIKKHDPDAQVLMISAVTQVYRINEAIEAGAEGFITKPFENQEVKEKVQELLGM